VYFKSYTKILTLFLLLSIVITSSFALSPTEENATYIYLPKVPQLETVIPVPSIVKKDFDALPYVTTTPNVETEIETMKKNKN